MAEINENDKSIESSLCRLCANVNQNGTYIFSEEVEENLSNLINKYLPLKVENDGRYPDKICPGCEIQLEATKLFFDLIIDGQNQLKLGCDGFKNTQILQLEDLQNVTSKTGTLEVHSIETGEKYFIQIMENTLADGPLYSAEHEMMTKMNILQKEKKKRGRPRKQPIAVVKKEDSGESSKNNEETIKNSNIQNEPLEDGKRHRKIPARFSETVQGKELDDILRKEGIVEEDYGLGCEIAGTLDKEVIGRVENQDGEEVEGAVIAKSVLNISRSRKNVIERRKRRRKFKCDKCLEEFKNYSRLKMHIHKIHAEDESEKNLNDATEGLEDRESQEKSGIEENSSSNLLDTLSKTQLETINEEAGDDAKIWNCDQCNESFKSEEDLTMHLRNKHPNGKRFMCPECSRCFSYVKTFEMHLQRHKKGIFTCEVCQKKFNHASSLIYHRNAEHNNGKRFVCNKCNKTFKHRQLLHRHQFVHTEERPYKCNICSSAFKTKTNLISHNSIHTGEKNYICSRCGQTFVHKTSLNLHMRWHLGEKPFTCEICKKRFSQKGNLMEHMRIHTGEKPFCCEICGRNFTTSSQLKLHTKRHTGERPWKCEFCPKTFLHKDTWKEHCRRHMNDRPFKCELCNKAFTAMYCLKKHMRFHTGEKPYSCDICLKGFSDLSNLTKHRRIHEQKSKENQSQNMSLLNTATDNLLYVYYETPKDQNIEVPLVDSEQAQSEVVISSDQDGLDFKGDCMHIQQLIDQEGNPLSLNTQDGQQINVVTSITNGEEKLQGLLPDGTLVALDLQDSKVENMKRLVDHVEEESSVSHLLLDGNMTFLNEEIDKPENSILVSEQPNICFVTYNPNAENIQ